MTIAIGIMCPEGFVLASDSEISTYGQGVDFSAEHHKIFPFYDSKNGVIAITGSGSIHYLEAIATTIGKAFKEHENETLPDLEPTFEAIVEEFYEHHVIPFGECGGWVRHL